MGERDNPITQTPISQTIHASQVRSHWGELLNRVYRNQARLVVEKSGIPVAAIISPAELARFNRLEAERAARFAVIDQIRDAFKDVPDAELGGWFMHVDLRRCPTATHTSSCRAS